MGNSIVCCRRRRSDAEEDAEPQGTPQPRTPYYKEATKSYFDANRRRIIRTYSRDFDPN
jgi:hypothetical protein